MKTVINIKSSRAAIKFVAGIVNKRSNLPILQNVHCYANGHFEMTATDLDVFLTAHCPTTSAVDGKTTLPARALQDMAAGKAEIVEFSADEKNIVTIAAGGNSRAVYGLSHEEFPPLPPMPGQHPQAGNEKRVDFMDAGKFIAALKAVAYGQSTDESRYILNGVCVEIGAENTQLIATDGRRLFATTLPRLDADGALLASIQAGEGEVAARKQALEQAQKDFPAAPDRISDSPEVIFSRAKLTEAQDKLSALYRGIQYILPAKAVQHILRLPLNKKAPAPISLSFWDVASADKENPAPSQYARIVCGDYSIVTKLIEGNYPNFRQVIPAADNCLHRITVPCVEFADTVTIAGKGCTEKANSVKLTFEKNLLTVSSKAPEVGEISEKMPVNFFVPAQTACGKTVQVEGTNGGSMPCGEMLTGLDGAKAIYYCGACSDKHFLAAQFTIAFNPAYLVSVADAFTAAGHNEMILEFRDELSPLKAVAHDGTLLAVVMPMRLS